MQDPHILEVGPAAQPLSERVVRPAERERWKQRFTVSVPSKRSRLAHQRPDHMSIIDSHVPSTSLPLHRGHEPLPMPDLNDLSIEPQLDLFADQPRADRVRVLNGSNNDEPRHLHTLPTEV